MNHCLVLNSKMPENQDELAAKRRKISLEHSKGLVPVFERPNDKHAAWFHAFVARHHENAEMRARAHANTVLIKVFELCARKSITAKNPEEQPEQRLSSADDAQEAPEDNAGNGNSGAEADGTVPKKKQPGFFCEGIQKTISDYMGRMNTRSGFAARLQADSRALARKAVESITAQLLDKLAKHARTEGGCGLNMGPFSDLAGLDRSAVPSGVLKTVKNLNAKAQWSYILERYPGIMTNLEEAGLSAAVDPKGYLSISWDD